MEEQWNRIGDIDVTYLQTSGRASLGKDDGAAHSHRSSPSTHSGVRRRPTAGPQEPGGGRVLVVEGGASMRCALLGDQLAAMAVANGWAGVIVNGCIRDSADIGAMPLGVKALATFPLKSSKRDPGLRDVPVLMAGVLVNPGGCASLRVHAQRHRLSLKIRAGVGGSLPATRNNALSGAITRSTSRRGGWWARGDRRLYLRGHRWRSSVQSG